MLKKLKCLPLVVMAAILLVSFSNMEDTKVSSNIDKDVEPLPFSFDEIRTTGKSENNNLHKYYISVSNATYSKSAKSMQMVTRFFIDDMEDVLNSRIENPIVLGDKSTIEEVYPLLKSYIAKKLEVQINGVNSIPSFIGAEYESDQIVLYIELPSPKMPKVITMRFNAFIELFEEQKNLVHMKINGVRRSLLMDKNKLTDTVKF
ncbi:hypothetical protein F0365_02685 [Nonlabens sp. Ci31]|uniref:DUF6702 family protein n=1 Tax=Nonlabens sp. Ci31 TaxID=2608253 RepID=UPI001462D4D5|nr:DUF6702 family protein [Nonlabens sp. Ci31]QJP33390.1 hypothetical protein F0365_02685 [Nonlabens sp. Ci31]